MSVHMIGPARITIASGSAQSHGPVALQAIAPLTLGAALNGALRLVLSPLPEKRL
jgi:hypothetical protein